MAKFKQLTEEDIKQVDMFNAFMLDKNLFIQKDWQIFQNTEPVMIDGFEYTMTDAVRDFTKLHN